MFVPSLRPRVKKRDTFFSLRIDSLSLRAFVAITKWAGKPEIFRDRLATSGQRDDMFDMHRYGDNGL
jgi:hypothetical protein